jgi:hypothetical protein
VLERDRRVVEEALAGIIHDVAHAGENPTGSPVISRE